MSLENEAYMEGQQLLRRMRQLERLWGEIDASDTQCKTRAVQLLSDARIRLEEALRELSRIV